MDRTFNLTVTYTEEPGPGRGCSVPDCDQAPVFAVATSETGEAKIVEFRLCPQHFQSWTANAWAQALLASCGYVLIELSKVGDN